MGTAINRGICHSTTDQARSVKLLADLGAKLNLPNGTTVQSSSLLTVTYVVHVRAALHHLIMSCLEFHIWRVTTSASHIGRQVFHTYGIPRVTYHGYHIVYHLSYVAYHI